MKMRLADYAGFDDGRGGRDGVQFVHQHQGSSSASNCTRWLLLYSTTYLATVSLVHIHPKKHVAINSIEGRVRFLMLYTSLLTSEEIG